MTRGILIAGNGSLLFSALCVEAAKRVESYAAALIPSGPGGTGDVPPGEVSPGDVPPGEVSSGGVPPGSTLPGGRTGQGASRRIMLDWNPASPISGRTLVLSTVNKMEHIDDAVLVCVPPSCRKNPEALAPAEIDALVDHNIKGWFFLIRELTAAFRNRGRGTLSLVLPEPGAGSKEDAPDMTGPAVAASFRSFAQNILLASISAPYDVFGFSSSGGGEENPFAAYVFKTMEEGKRGRGKWHKYGKFGFWQ